MSITLEQAEQLSEAAKAKAKEIGVPMNIAIVDAGANLVSFHRMDNAWLGSVDIAIKKAKTARFFDMNTGDWANSPSLEDLCMASSIPIRD